MGNNTPYLGKQEEQQIQERKEQSPFTKRILIVDDDPDITFTFKKAFEEANRISSGNKVSFHVNAYNDPLLALSEFKPDFYDLMLVDINMPKMNGFDFCVKVFEVDLNPKVYFYDLMLVDINMPKMNGFDFCVKVFEVDLNPKVCFISLALINQEALKEQYPSLSFGCFIEQPITIENLIRRVRAELE